MKRRRFVQSASAALAALSAPSLAFGKDQQKRPNILWVTCEDSSPNLGCYGDPQARTPNLDKLAAEGMRYDNAFTVAPVCAPSRSCLITGVYPTTLGTLHMRCRNQPRDPVECFPEYLRKAGYYCTNNSKEDYNFKTPSTVWNESSGKAHFRNRPDKDQHFFAVFNFTITHESRIGTLTKDLGEQERALVEAIEPHDPAKIILPPYYPDTEIIRRHWAHYYDLVTAMDGQVGQILRELEEDGLAKETVVFFFSDHGVGAPRGKRTLYDSGLHVPLIVRWPEQVRPGDTTDRLVSFVDFAPTLLSIVGLPIPEYMQGIPFLGSAEGPPRDRVYAARDRMDERYDMFRAVRDKRFKYIRNYEPRVPYDLPLSYPESFPIMQELRRVKAENGLDGPQSLFFRKEKPVEELYDTAADPFELHNLASDPAHAKALETLRSEMDRWMGETHDLGLVPEFELAAWLASGGKDKAGGSAAYRPLQGSAGASELFGKSANRWIEGLNSSDPLVRYRGIKSLAILGAPAIPALLSAMKDADSIVAYWAARAFGEIEPLTADAEGALQQALARREAGPRLGVAYALIRHGKQEAALPVSLNLMEDENPFVRLGAVEMLELVGPQNEQVAAALQKALTDGNEYVVRRAKRVLGIAVR
jgi:uncharacterized sulfatase